jgi:hypothetical protein
MAAAVGASMAWVFWPRQEDLGSGMDMVECGDDLGTFSRPRGGDPVGKQSVGASGNSLSSMRWLHREERRGRRPI